MSQDSPERRCIHDLPTRKSTRTETMKKHSSAPFWQQTKISELVRPFLAFPLLSGQTGCCASVDMSTRVHVERRHEDMWNAEGHLFGTAAVLSHLWGAPLTPLLTRAGTAPALVTSRPLDAEFANDPSGCTAVAALLVAGPPPTGVESKREKVARRIIVANAGDSRCVLSLHGYGMPLSYDHKPGNKGKWRRISLWPSLRCCAHTPYAKTLLF